MLLSILVQCTVEASEASVACKGRVRDQVAGPHGLVNLISGMYFCTREVLSRRFIHPRASFIICVNWAEGLVCFSEFRVVLVT